MAFNNHRLLIAKDFQGFVRNRTFRAWICGLAFFICLWIVVFPRINQDFLGTTNNSALGKENFSPSVATFSSFPDGEEGDGQIQSHKNVLRISGKGNDIPVTILAAGDIAKCNDEDEWQERFLKLVGWVPDTGPKEHFLENLLELLSIREEVDFPATAASTANLILRLPGKVLALGDLAYPTGSTRQFRECYESTWGRFKARTYPVPGNHEYKQKNTTPYFDYWGHRAGEFGRGYYSFNEGGWHIIALNSKLEKSNYEHPISAQHAWLQKDLASTQGRCLLAFWHHPVFSSGQHSGSLRMKNILKTLYQFGVTVVLNGHAHNYERFAPQNPDGGRDLSRGFRQFVVGTGGVPLRPLKTRQPNSEVFQAEAYGVLRLDLYSNHYAWQFIPVEGNQPSDRGTGVCISSRSPHTL